jgi:LEA14-like dessication related protein
MIKSLRSIGIFLFVALFFSGCGIQEVGIGEITDFQINKIDFSGVSFDIVIPIENPNGFSFKLKKIKVSVFSDTTLLGTAINDKPILISKNSSKDYHLPLTIKYASLKNAPMQVLQMFFKRSAHLHLKGFARVTKGLLWKTIPIDETRNYQLRRHH